MQIGEVFQRPVILIWVVCELGGVGLKTLVLTIIITDFVFLKKIIIFQILHAVAMRSYNERLLVHGHINSIVRIPRTWRKHALKNLYYKHNKV